MTDPHGRRYRWRLSRSNFYFTVVYRPGLVKQVPNALSPCTADARDDPEIEYDIPRLDCNVLALTRAQMVKGET